MSLDVYTRIPQHMKRRRRRFGRPPISGKLVLDEHVKGDIGYFSEDLLADLAPSFALQAKLQDLEAILDSSKIYYIAVSPWCIPKKVEETTWTIVGARNSKDLGHSTFKFSPSSRALQSFAATLHRVAPSKLIHQLRQGIDVKILDVVPLSLETVFVTIDNELAKRLENGEGTFYERQPHVNGHPNGVRAVISQEPEDRLASAVRKALASLLVIHSDDVFSLPLLPHPATHIPALPAKVTLCEPVSQGVLASHSRIVITRTSPHDKSPKPQPQPLKTSLNGVSESDEDTSNDQFYSAAEDRDHTDSAIEDGQSARETDTDDAASDTDSRSDDSMEDMISLHIPMLPARSVNGTSIIQPGTPQNIRSPSQDVGASTPRSVFTSYTANTARPQSQTGRIFKVQALMMPLPSELLHPKPASDDDPEARVYIDTIHLTRIGCFSGDWVQYTTAAAPVVNEVGLTQSSHYSSEQDDASWRPVRVYGLPEGYSQRRPARLPVKTSESRRTSFFESQVQKSSNPVVCMSPLLLANMDGTSYCWLSPLKRTLNSMKSSQTKITNGSRPPVAQELHLSKISSPFSMEGKMQNALFAGLQKHFEDCTRIVRKGDLVAIPVDEELSKVFYHPGAGEKNEVDDLLSKYTMNTDDKESTRPTAVGWFRVSATVIPTKDADKPDEEDIWGGCVSVDATSTMTRQSGSEMSLIPMTLTNPWEYYLGLKSRVLSSSAAASLPEYKIPPATLLQRRSRELIAAATSPRAIHLKMPPLSILLVSSHRNIGKKTVISRACAELGLHMHITDAYEIASEGGSLGDKKTTDLLEADARRATSCGPQYCALLIRHIEALTADRMVTTLKDIIASVRVVIATTSEVDKIPDGMRGLFSHELEMHSPDEGERENILRSILDEQPVPLALDVDISAVAVKTAALVAGDLVDVVERALVARQSRLESLASSSTTTETLVTVRDVLIAGGPSSHCLTKSDFDIAVEAARKNFADAIGAPKIPNVSWDDVGGLTNVKEAVMETIQLPLERPELFAKGMKKRSGILFYGPPGTGKTLLAKAIATELSLNFFSVKGPELLNMYIGESEANVRRVFQRARDARPCVVFFDELDSVAPKRGNQGDSGGVMDRIVSQVLAELDGMSDREHGSGGVFVIGATNRPDLLDPALLRPGRFDKMLYLGVSDTHEKQLTIMEALTRKFTLHPTLSLSRIATRLPFTYTGADFYALCSDAMLKAVTRQAALVDAKIKEINVTSGKPEISTAYFFDHFATKDDVAVMVREEDFVNAEKDLVPSVSAKELEHYRRVRAQFEQEGSKDLHGDLIGKGKEYAVADGLLDDWQSTNGKGKGRAVDLHGKFNGKDQDVKGKGRASLDFHDGTPDDDEGLY